jgi:hypothetical protein
MSSLSGKGKLEPDKIPLLTMLKIYHQLPLPHQLLGFFLSVDLHGSMMLTDMTQLVSWLVPT